MNQTHIGRSPRELKIAGIVIRFIIFEIICYGLYLWYCASKTYNDSIGIGFWGAIKAVAIPNPIYIVATFPIFFAGYKFIKTKWLAELLFRRRYVIAITVFLLCVAFGISGSSIGTFSYFLRGNDPDVLLGINRPIRSDEWAVWTPMVASQYYDPAGPFSYFSSVIRATSTDVFLEYGTPVLSWVSIFRPFHLGFLFLPLANGMAFFWAGRQIALLLVSFEFGRKITEDDRVLSVIYALLVAFAPPVQWWFAICGLVEMLIYVQLSILVLTKYLHENRTWVKVVYALIVLICAGGFGLTMYPSWMIPMAYVLLALIVWAIVVNRKNFHFGVKDVCLVLFVIAVLAGAVFYVYRNSEETINLIMGTAYPGERFELGGGYLPNIFTYLTNLLSPLLGYWPFSNECENSNFISFFPLSLLLLIVLSMNKKTDALCRCLLCAELILGIWCVFGFPEGLAKLSLMSNSQAGRTLIAFQFCDMLLLFRELTLIKTIPVRKSVACLLGGFVALICGAVMFTDYASVLPKPVLAACGIVGGLFCLGVIIYTQKHSRNGFLLLLTAVIVTVSGIIVNPVRVGMSATEELLELQMIRKYVKSDPKAIWIVDSISFPLINIPLLAGARTLNSTNVYPDLERWHQIDSKREYEEVYNRYAHIPVNIKDIETEEDKFELLYADQFRVSLTPTELKKLGVKYIYSSGELNSDSFILLDFVNDYRVYQLLDN